MKTLNAVKHKEWLHSNNALVGQVLTVDAMVEGPRPPYIRFGKECHLTLSCPAMCVAMESSPHGRGSPNPYNRLCETRASTAMSAPLSYTYDFTHEVVRYITG